MAIREGKWKCPGCGEINRGAVVQCAQCGATRDANTKFFLDENDAPVVSDTEQLKKAQGGADWVCSFCDNSNPQGSPICQGCGAAPQGKVHKSGDVIPVGGAPASTPPPVPVPPKSGGKAGALFGAFFLMLLLFCCCCFGWTHRSHESVGTVAKVEWERSIEVESVRPVHETAWDSAPQGAYDVSHARAVRDHKQVQRGTKTVYRKEKVKVGSHKVVTGHRDLGNGHFEDVEKDLPDYEMQDVAHEEPVYDTVPVYGEQYSYTIDKWVAVRQPETKGTSETPAWPETALEEKEREGARHESYTVWFQVKDETDQVVHHPKTEADFMKLRPGTEWTIKWSSGSEAEVLGPAGVAAGAGRGH